MLTTLGLFFFQSEPERETVALSVPTRWRRGCTTGLIRVRENCSLCSLKGYQSRGGRADSRERAGSAQLGAKVGVQAA